MNIIYIMRSAVSAVVGVVGSAWQWLRPWLGSCLPVCSPDKDEIARIDLTGPWAGFGFQDRSGRPIHLASVDLLPTVRQFSERLTADTRGSITLGNL